MVNNDPELSAEARQVIADASALDEPTAEDRSRVRGLWLTGIAAAAGVSALGQAAHAAGTAWGLKAMGAALAVAAGVAGIYAVLPGDEQTAATAVPPSHEEVEKAVVPAPPPVAETVLPGVAAPPPVAVAPRISEAASEQPSSPEKALARPSQPATALPLRAPAPATAVPLAVASKSEAVPATESPNVQVEGDSARAPLPSQQSGQLGEELALLSKIRSSVQEGAGARALELLGEYQSRFDRPVLGMEAAALRIDALCQSGQRDAARAAIEVFQGNWPGSPLEQRVRSACP